ncbi:MAG: hypothetical protein EBU08_11305 [Micrococcales bacterium]|nr:hypothetical protein [Micrococcales bacterium]
MKGALNELRFAISDSMTVEELRGVYISFLSSVVQEISDLVSAGSFDSDHDLDEWLSDYVDGLDHVVKPSEAKVFMVVTRNAEAIFEVLNKYEDARDATIWYQMAFHAQVADLKDELGLAGVYNWFRRPSHGESTRYEYEHLS